MMDAIFKFRLLRPPTVRRATRRWRLWPETRVLALTLLQLWSLARPADSVVQDTPPHSVKCYSCMSKLYENLWGSLQNTYRRPHNFTDLCNRGQSQTGVGLIECPSICIKMWEKTAVGGHPVVGMVRGCYDNMLLRGFNTTIVQWYRWLQRDSCHYYRQKDVLQLPFDTPGQVYICTCYADGCNGSPRLSRTASTLLPGHWPIVPLALLSLLFFFLFWSDSLASR